MLIGCQRVEREDARKAALAAKGKARKQPRASKSRGA